MNLNMTSSKKKKIKCDCDSKIPFHHRPNCTSVSTNNEDKVKEAVEVCLGVHNEENESTPERLMRQETERSEESADQLKGLRKRITNNEEKKLIDSRMNDIIENATLTSRIPLYTKQVEDCGCVNYAGNGWIAKYCPKHLAENVSTPSSWEERFMERFIELHPKLDCKQPTPIWSYDALIDFIRQVEKESYERGRRETGEKAVTLYNQAIGDTELTEEVWKKIAQVNSVLLNLKS